MSTKKEELNFPVTSAAKCLNQKEVSNIIPKFTLENINSGNTTEHKIIAIARLETWVCSVSNVSVF